jgi:NAD(P)-dependent dehydrogenase (short-subunit alcohol dehydrogenase family)
MKAVSQDEPRGAEVVKTAVGTLGVAVTRDDFGKQGNAGYFADVSARNPARRIGTTGDIANRVLFVLTSTLLTGETLHIDSGERPT